jgi:hypothetical protein
MPDPKAQAAPVAKAPVASAANPPAPAPATLAIDERFAQLAAQLIGQVEAQIEALQQEFATQFGTNVDPLHKDLHDLLDMLTQAGAKIEKLEAANFVTPEGLKEQADQIADAIVESSRRRYSRSFSRRLPSSIQRSRIALRRSRASSDSSDHEGSGGQTANRSHLGL